MLIRGKVLGGSSAINGMMWTRGTVGQYDALEELGNPGWNFTSLQGYRSRSSGCPCYRNSYSIFHSGL